jgi:hypothetical protein
MKSNARSSLAASFAVVCLLFPHASHAADAARDAAIKFGTGWTKFFEEVGVAGLGNIEYFNERKEKLGPYRKVMRENGSKELRQAGEQLDILISYVARAVFEGQDNHDDASNWARPGEEPPLAFVYVFRDPKLNALLEIDTHADPPKVAAALA